MNPQPAIGDLVYAFYFGQTDKPMIGIVVSVNTTRVGMSTKGPLYGVVWQYTHELYQTRECFYHLEDMNSFRNNLEFFKKTNGL